MAFSSSGQCRWEALTHTPSAGNASQKMCRFYFKNTQEPYSRREAKGNQRKAEPTTPQSPGTHPGLQHRNSGCNPNTRAGQEAPGESLHPVCTVSNNCSRSMKPPAAEMGENRSCSTTTTAAAGLSNREREALVLQPLQQCIFAQRRRLGKLQAVHVKVCRTQHSSRGFQGSSFKFNQILARGQRA